MLDEDDFSNGSGGFDCIDGHPARPRQAARAGRAATSSTIAVLSLAAASPISVDVAQLTVLRAATEVILPLFARAEVVLVGERHPDVTREPAIRITNEHCNVG
jgi:hypothetical protein